MRKSWMHLCVMILICFCGQTQIVHGVQAGTPDHAMAWDPLPNGLMSIAYDRTGDGIPDHFTLHPITWAGWSSQGIEEIERQACMDEQWVFMVEYAQDRYVYFAQPIPVLFGDDPRQTGIWRAENVRVTDVKASQPLNPTAYKPGHEPCLIGTPRQQKNP